MIFLFSAFQDDLLFDLDVNLQVTATESLHNNE